jgi:hypothetical protein
MHCTSKSGQEPRALHESATQPACERRFSCHGSTRQTSIRAISAILAHGWQRQSAFHIGRKFK